MSNFDKVKIIRRSFSFCSMKHCSASFVCPLYLRSATTVAGSGRGDSLAPFCGTPSPYHHPCHKKLRPPPATTRHGACLFCTVSPSPSVTPLVLSSHKYVTVVYRHAVRRSHLFNDRLSDGTMSHTRTSGAKSRSGSPAHQTRHRISPQGVCARTSMTQGSIDCRLF